MTIGNRKAAVTILSAFGFASILIYVLWFHNAAPSAVALEPDDETLVALGQTLYQRECAACHGTALEGQENWQTRLSNGRLPAPPHDASGHTWHHPDGQLFALTKFGPAALAGGDYESDMPAYEEVLSDREIVAVLSFIKSRWPMEIRKRHDQINARYQSQAN